MKQQIAETKEAPTTLAALSRVRRDIVSGAVMDEARLIRFVAGPDGSVVPDLGRKLPGRGLWVAANRASVETAAKKGAFARAAKTRLTAPADLADRVAEGLRLRLLSALGLARRSGELTSGFAKVLAAIETGRAAHWIEASDGAQDGRRKLMAASRRSPRPPTLSGLFDGVELDLALGLENVIHTALLAGRAADRWTCQLERLAGFRALFPDTWREEPGDERRGADRAASLATYETLAGGPDFPSPQERSADE